MNTAIAPKANHADNLEKAVITGDLSGLTAEERLHYYKQTCDSLGLNPLTKPFEYVKLNNKLTLYARKDATDQLRKIHAISIDEPKIQFEGDWIIVTVLARTPEGRTDSDIGVVAKKDMQGNFGNALMKAVTKSKRRVTLSICGLGMLDETEVESIPHAVTGDNPTAELPAPAIEADPVDAKWNEAKATVKELCNQLNAAGDSIKWTPKALNEYVNGFFEVTDGVRSLSLSSYVELIADLQERLEELTTPSAE